MICFMRTDSAAGLQVEDWFCVDDLVSALEGELEAAEVSEGAPAAAYGRPIEQLEAIAVGDRTQPGHGGVAAAMAQRVAATAGLHLEGLEPGDDLGKLGIGRGHGRHCDRAVRSGKGSNLIRAAAARRCRAVAGRFYEGDATRPLPSLRLASATAPPDAACRVCGFHPPDMVARPVAR